MRLICAAAGAVALAGAADAQPPVRRTPADRQAVAELAYTLGEAHALHRLCAGPTDATWYARMRQLMAAEAPDEGFRRRLVDSFNAGYQTSLTQFAACGRESQAAERRAAARGAAIARAMAGGGGSD